MGPSDDDRAVKPVRTKVLADPPAPQSQRLLAARAVHLLNRAALDAVCGHESSCRTAVAEAGIVGHRAGLAALEIAADHVLGLLELSMRNLPAAAWHLTRCARTVGTLRHVDPYVVRFEPDLVEVLVGLGRRSEAQIVAASLTARAGRLDLAWSTMAAARCRGMVASEAEFEAEFLSALASSGPAGETGDPFESARSQLCFGERLRRARRRVEARGYLARALETFRSIGATPWSDRAARELGATSCTARRRDDPSTIDDLTPQEAHAARLVAEGATVREAAGRMFLSPKTVEAHLGRAYRKLGVHNRAQLALAMTRLAGHRVSSQSI
jgi:DNA-binding CsgD family transcriptional regulator